MMFKDAPMSITKSMGQFSSFVLVFGELMLSVTEKTRSSSSDTDDENLTCLTMDADMQTHV